MPCMKETESMSSPCHWFLLVLLQIFKFFSWYRRRDFQISLAIFDKVVLLFAASDYNVEKGMEELSLPLITTGLLAF